MQIQRKHPLLRIVSFFLLISLLVSTPAYAAVNETFQPRASLYLTSYSTYICAMGGGDIQIWFEVMGTGTMDEIGVLSIELYESTDNVNWSWKKTYLSDDFDEMLVEKDYFHCSYVPYDGVANRYYKAYVCIWAGKNGGGDSRYRWTPVERAT